MVFVCAVIVVAFRSKISPGIAGLIIVYALQVFDSLTWVIKQLSQLETSSVSLERICEYIRVSSYIFFFCVNGIFSFLII